MRVLRPTRRIHIRRRGRVLRNSPPPASVRSANRPEPWPRLAPSGVRRGARGLGLSHAPCAAAPVVFAAIRAAMLRRRDTGFSPCDVSHRASDEPRRRMSLSSALAPSSLASPSNRRVFLRSICARRRFVSELNPRQMCRDAIRRYMTLTVSRFISSAPNRSSAGADILKSQQNLSLA